MTNLNSIVKSRDITLPTKVRLVKAMVFPVVMYRCEGWTVKKAEHQGTDTYQSGSIFWLATSHDKSFDGLNNMTGNLQNTSKSSKRQF